MKVRCELLDILLVLRMEATLPVLARPHLSGGRWAKFSLPTRWDDNNDNGACDCDDRHPYTKLPATFSSFQVVSNFLINQYENTSQVQWSKFTKIYHLYQLTNPHRCTVYDTFTLLTRSSPGTLCNCLCKKVGSPKIMVLNPVTLLKPRSFPAAISIYRHLIDETSCCVWFP